MIGLKILTVVLLTVSCGCIFENSWGFTLGRLNADTLGIVVTGPQAACHSKYPILLHAESHSIVECFRSDL